MSYVDLYPIRAGVAENLESSWHTSAALRISTIKADSSAAKAPLSSLNVAISMAVLPIATEDYLDLIDWTARQTRADKRGRIEATQPPILRKLGLTETQWHAQMLGAETRYWRAIGSARSLIEKAAAIGQSWLKGIGRAQQLTRRQIA